MVAAHDAAGAAEIPFPSIVAELEQRGAGRLAHGRWSLLGHLLGTHALLAGWSQARHIVLMGLFHSVYSTEAYAPRLFAPGERDRVRELIGARAERLVYLFSQTARADVVALLPAASATPATELELHSRTTGGSFAVTPSELAELAVVHVANTAEQQCGDDGGPALWLARASKTAADARALLANVPPIFAGCSATVTHESERRLVAAYRTAWTAAPAGAARLAAALDAMPWVGEPYVCLGFRLLGWDPQADLRPLAATARARLNAWGAAWDKRLTRAQWLELTDVLTAAADLPAPDRAFSAERMRAILAPGRTPEALYTQLRSVGIIPDGACATRRFDRAPGEPALPARFVEYVAGLGDNHERPMMGHYPGLTSRPWHDPAQFPLARALERQAADIIAEIRALDRAEFHVERENIARSGNWDVFMLLERGRIRREAETNCPATGAILAGHQVIRSLAGLAYVSRLAPMTDLAAHRGPTNLRLRCHLGITVPDDCGLAVDGVSGGWTEGRCIVFDDSFTHAAWNHSGRDRLVLVVDVWHPDLTPREIELLEGLHRYAQAHAENLAAYWGRNEQARRGAAGSPQPVAR